MVRKGDIRTIEAVGNKSMGTKRTVDNGQVRSSRKRQKTLQQILPELKPQTEQVQHETQTQDQVFRFMDLPGELRNRVYEYATEYTIRCFPPIFPKEKPTLRRSRSSGSPPLANNSSKDSPRPIPYIGLTQSCSLLRSEFRPDWLCAHKIPLCAIDGYLKVFFPRPDPRASPEARKRFQTQFHPSGSLRVWVRKSEMSNVDITKVMKHVSRFPNYSFFFASYVDIRPSLLAAVEALVKNKNPTWTKWIKNNTISQIRLMIGGPAGNTLPYIRVVIKERHAPQWMRALPPTGVPPVNTAPFAEKLGLSEVQKVWSIVFGVDYS
ncbi:hypothetical protein CC86DRAFT_354162 [Ophiobolus disseminans]|uniref:F-box domain-containing protein n=1 Tax=Ophiobolus disseminans TaxID=1469910 RepID=A0A6A6ZV83_9PLEO|nr:hypothetical protein CC86DRAFT_354162 [Ophiobolus disseminans]